MAQDSLCRGSHDRYIYAHVQTVMPKTKKGAIDVLALSLWVATQICAAAAAAAAAAAVVATTSAAADASAAAAVSVAAAAL